MSEERLPDGGGPDRDGAWTRAVPLSAGEQSMTAAELDSLFGVLADRRRRRLLAYLAGTDDGVATVSELADHVAADDADPERVTVSLHHAHLPRLEDAGIVEYDARSETVRYRGDPTVTAWVEFVRR